MKKTLAVLVMFAAACTTAPKPQTTPAASARPLLGDHGFNTAGLDRNVAACDNFYEFAVGNWRKAHPLPAAYSRFGNFEDVAERNRETLHTILEQAAADRNAPAGSATRKLGDFYGACMAESAIESAGISPIAPELARINAISDRAQLQDEIFRLQTQGVRPVFALVAENDFKRSDMIIATLTQGGLGLPDRDYYLRDDDRFKTTRKQYLEHMTRMFALAGVPEGQASADAERVMQLETELARASMSRVEQRTPSAVYHITPVSDLGTVTPGVEWNRLMSLAGLGELKTVNVAQPEFFRTAARLLGEAPLESWKAYLRWRVIDNAAPTLSSAFVNESFNFRNRTLSGQKEMQPRWQRCVRAADTSVGQLLGQEYVRRAFTPEAKRKMNELIDNLITALREDIPTLTWMGPATKQAALVKLDAFRRRIGYPEKWIDYATLDVSRDSYAANVAAARQFSFRRSMSRVSKPDDPNEWGFFTPPTVNAGYNPARNDITFPAGILQPPFYDPNADDAYNYGGIGSVIGHEMTHGFDDEGAQFDEKGNLRDWWTPEDKARFQERSACIATQYSEFEVEKGLNIQGKLVTGEAIADLGGVTLAYRAYEKSQQGKAATIVDGFTPEQRFFLGFAQVWAENMAPEEMRRRALVDVHAQGPFRVNATVANMPEFFRAFSCKEGQAMVRDTAKRCSIW